MSGRSLELTRREFELIELLAGGEGRVLEREEIYSRLWGYAMVRGDRSVDVFVRKLRQKLEKASPQWRYIHTHFGIGYRFAAEHNDAQQAENAAPTEQAGAGIEEEIARFGGTPGGAVPRGSAVGGEPHSTLKPGGLDTGRGDFGDQGELGGAQQEYELSTTGA